MYLSEGAVSADSRDSSRLAIVKILFNEMPTQPTPPAPAGPPKQPDFEFEIECPRHPKPKIPQRLPWTPIVPKRPPTIH
ncbi:MAG: hypothetical protein A2V81_04975 [Candidatus Abawacabacteria bacterium RBG_16_42_10]|uniref:Uncharacterized protein n=1 Tax=Candidatus Abawacabacteria bacterium RBG_16_42_10 TaxID=1817814 RepID=A0A1F4XJ04_9BACT|nr:MAG: hypothetical protein A2V81_04975 [Candidatus Abawacabacteria bacterium RBG_16_42_10]